MPMVLACIEFDTQGTCVEQAWIEQPAGLPVALPSIEQAEVLGAAIFVSWFTLAAFKTILKPPKEHDS